MECEQRQIDWVELFKSESHHFRENFLIKIYFPVISDVI